MRNLYNLLKWLQECREYSGWLICIIEAYPIEWWPNIFRAPVNRTENGDQQM